MRRVTKSCDASLYIRAMVDVCDEYGADRDAIDEKGRGDELRSVRVVVLVDMLA